MEHEMVMAYELNGKRIALHKCEGELVITNSFTNKSILCLGWQHALDIFDTCVQTIKETSA
jgi:hypothetical protein